MPPSFPNNTSRVEHDQPRVDVLLGEGGLVRRDEAGDLRRRLVQQCYLRVGHGPIHRSDVLLCLLHCPSSRNRDRPLRPRPVQSDLTHGDVVPVVGRHLPHRAQKSGIPVRREELLPDLAPWPGRKIALVVLAREESQRQRRVRQHLHVQLLANVEQSVLLGPPVQQRVLNLIRRQLDTPFLQLGVGRPRRVDAVVRHSHGLDQSLLVAHGDAVPVFLVRPRVGKVNLIQIDGTVRAQPFQARLARVHHVLRLGPEGKRRELGGDLHLIGLFLGVRVAELTQQSLGSTEAVYFGGIEEGQILRQCVVEDLLQVVVVLLVVPPEDRVAPRPRPQTDRGKIDRSCQAGGCCG
mmetsp:Transcript_686/g.2049  ORF Transcript_686/g.2049 Transcript_686/m.2049 type:complete len:350 (+) Transcript_686:99-1148(+)